MDVQKVREALIESYDCGTLALRRRDPLNAASAAATVAPAPPPPDATQGKPPSGGGGGEPAVGVFATRTVHVGEYLGAYTGEFRSVEASAGRHTAVDGFAFRVDDSTVIDPHATPPTDDSNWSKGRGGGGAEAVPARQLRSVCILHFVNQPRWGERCTARFFIDRVVRACARSSSPVRVYMCRLNAPPPLPPQHTHTRHLAAPA
jgi:hypothetical protein